MSFDQERQAYGIGVYTEPWDQSQRIVNVLMDHHRKSKVDGHGRGLKKYTAINTTEFQDSVSPVMRGISKAKSDHVAIISGNTQMVSLHSQNHFSHCSECQGKLTKNRLNMDGIAYC